MHALVVAFRAQLGAFRTAFGTVSADGIYTVDTFVAGDAVVAIAARTVITDAAFTANAAVGALFAFFKASLAYQCTVNAAVAAFTYKVYAVFTMMAFGAIVTFTANTVKTGHAVQTKTVTVTFAAFFATVFAAESAVRASFAAVADPLRTFDAYITGRAIIVVSYAVGTLVAAIADPVGAP